MRVEEDTRSSNNNKKKPHNNNKINSDKKAIINNNTNNNNNNNNNTPEFVLRTKNEETRVGDKNSFFGVFTLFCFSLLFLLIWGS